MVVLRISVALAFIAFFPAMSMAAEAKSVSPIEQDHCFANGAAFDVGSSFCTEQRLAVECHAGATTSDPAAWHNSDQECSGPEASTADSDSADHWACRNGDIEACTRFLDSGRKDSDQRMQAFYSRGDVYLKRSEHYRGNPDHLSAEDRLLLGAAESDYSEAIALSPTFSDLYRIRGRFREAQQHFLGAIADYRKAHDLEAAAGARFGQDHCFSSNGAAYDVGSSFCSGKNLTRECHAGAEPSSLGVWHYKYNADQECIGPAWPPPP